MQTTANVSTLVDANLEGGRGGKTALITADDRRLTYSEVHALVNRVAARLRDMGVGREDRLLLVLDDTPVFPATFLGAMRIGEVPIPVNFLARPQDFGYFLDDSYAVAAVVDSVFLEKVGPEVAARDHIRLIVANGEAGDAESMDDWLAEGTDEVDPVPTHDDDMAFWLYSSGSTGPPKGVVHHHANVAATSRHYAQPILGINQDDVVFSSTKMFHAYGLGNSLTFPFAAGATAVVEPTRPPNPALVAGIVGEFQPTLFFCIPTFYAALAASDLADDAFASVRLAVSAAEPLPADTYHRFADRFGVQILDGIGSTEMTHIYVSNAPGALRRGPDDVHTRDEPRTSSGGETHQ